MILDKEIEINLTSNVVKHYENLGYIIPRVKSKHINRFRPNIFKE